MLTASQRLLVLACGLAWPLSASAAEPFRYPEGRHGKGELRYTGTMPVLTAEGTPAEIGEQIGALALKPLAPQVEALVKKFVGEYGLAYPVLKAMSGNVARKLPTDCLAEIDGMARAGGIDRDLLLIINTFADLQHVLGCSVVVVEPNRSITGKMIVGRNADHPPVGDLYRYALLTVRRPAGKRAFASFSYPGTLFGGSDMNDAGLCVCGNDARETKDGSPATDPAGQPYFGVGRRVMEECATVADAEKLVAGWKAITTGIAIVSDPREGAVFEVTTRNVRARRSAGGLNLCTNHFRAPDLAADTKCWRYTKLEERAGRDKWSVAHVAEALHAVNQQSWTGQTIIFEPADLCVHLAAGPGPATALPRVTIECGPLFRGGR